jgi:hypothetical protein
MIASKDIDQRQYHRNSNSAACCCCADFEEASMGSGKG